MASSTRQWYGGPNFQMIKRGSTGRKGGSHSGTKGESPIGTKNRKVNWSLGQNPEAQAKADKAKGRVTISLPHTKVRPQGKRHT